MELYSIEASCTVFHSRYRAVIRMSGDDKAFRRAADIVGMTHPAGVDIVSRCQDPALVIDRDLCAAVLARRCGINAPAETVCHELRAVADPEDRDAKREYAVIYRRRAFSVSALRPSRKYYSVRSKLLYGRCVHFIKIMYFRIDSAFSDAAGNQLVVLSAEVYYKDPAFCHEFLLLKTRAPV